MDYLLSQLCINTAGSIVPRECCVADGIMGVLVRCATREVALYLVVGVGTVLGHGVAVHVVVVHLDAGLLAHVGPGGLTLVHHVVRVGKLGTSVSANHSHKDSHQGQETSLQSVRNHI